MIMTHTILNSKLKMYCALMRLVLYFLYRDYSAHVKYLCNLDHCVMTYPPDFADDCASLLASGFFVYGASFILILFSKSYSF